VAPGCPGVAGMMAALVLDHQFLRREALRKHLAQARRTGRAVQGSTCR
jgi:hypothetical protein